MSNSLKHSWVLVLFGAILFLAPTSAVADCLCADLIPAIGICDGDGCSNINYSVCSSDSFNNCNLCVPSARFSGCCDGGPFYPTMKSGGRCMVAGIINKKTTLNADSRPAVDATWAEDRETVLLILPYCDRGYFKLRTQ